MTRPVALFCLLVFSMSASAEHFHSDHGSLESTAPHSHHDHEDEHNDHPQTPLELPKFNLDRVKQISREITQKIFKLRPHNWAEVQEINGASIEHHPLEGRFPKYRPLLVARTSAQITRAIEEMNPQSWGELGDILKEFQTRISPQVMKNIIAHKAFHKPTSALDDDFDSDSSQKLGDIPELDKIIDEKNQKGKSPAEDSPKPKTALDDSRDPFGAFKNDSAFGSTPTGPGSSIGTGNKTAANSRIPQQEDESSPISGMKAPSRPGDVKTSRSNSGFPNRAFGSFNAGQSLPKMQDFRSNGESSFTGESGQEGNEETISTYNPPSSGASDPVLDQAPVINPQSPFPSLVQIPSQIQSPPVVPGVGTQLKAQSSRTTPFITAGQFTDGVFPDGKRKFIPTEPGKQRENVAFQSGGNGGYYNPLPVENNGEAIPSAVGQTLVIPAAKSEAIDSKIPPLFQQAGKNLFANMASRRNFKVATSSMMPSFEIAKGVSKKQIVRAVAASTGLGEEQSTTLYHTVLGLAWLATVGFVSYVGRAVYEAAQEPQES